MGVPASAWSKAAEQIAAQPQRAATANGEEGNVDAEARTKQERWSVVSACSRWLCRYTLNRTTDTYTNQAKSWRSLYLHFLGLRFRPPRKVDLQSDRCIATSGFQECSKTPGSSQDNGGHLLASQS